MKISEDLHINMYKIGYVYMLYVYDNQRTPNMVLG